MRRIIKVCFAAIHQIDVYPSVVVVVEECAAGTAGLRQMLGSGFPCLMRPRDATERRWYLFEGRERCRVFSEEKGQSREPGGAGENTQIAKECAPGKPCPRPVGLLIHSVGDVLLGHSN